MDGGQLDGGNYRAVLKSIICRMECAERPSSDYTTYNQLPGYLEGKVTSHLSPTDMTIATHLDSISVC